MGLYSMADYKYDYGQTISTDVEDHGVDRAFFSTYSFRKTSGSQCNSNNESNSTKSWSTGWV